MGSRSEVESEGWNIIERVGCVNTGEDRASRVYVDSQLCWTNVLMPGPFTLLLDLQNDPFDLHTIHGSYLPSNSLNL